VLGDAESPTQGSQSATLLNSVHGLSNNPTGMELVVDSSILTVLFYGHILSAMGWLGGGLFTTFVVGPGLQTLSPSSRLEFIARVIPKVLRFVIYSAVGTMGFGVLLYAYSLTDSSFSPSWALYTGVGLALIVAAIAFSITIPSFRRMSKIAQSIVSGETQGPPPPEMQVLARRAGMGALVGTAILLAVLGMMVISVVMY